MNPALPVFYNPEHRNTSDGSRWYGNIHTTTSNMYACAHTHTYIHANIRNHTQSHTNTNINTQNLTHTHKHTLA